MVGGLVGGLIVMVVGLLLWLAADDAAELDDPAHRTLRGPRRGERG